MMEPSSLISELRSELAEESARIAQEFAVTGDGRAAVAHDTSMSNPSSMNPGIALRLRDEETECSTKVQQPRWRRLTASDPGRPADLRQRPSGPPCLQMVKEVRYRWRPKVGRIQRATSRAIGGPLTPVSEGR